MTNPIYDTLFAPRLGGDRRFLRNAMGKVQKNESRQDYATRFAR